MLVDFGDKNAKRIIIVIAILLVVIIFFLLSRAPVVAFKLEKADVEKGVTVSGVVNATIASDINPNVTSTIIKILIKDGEYVKKNQPLAILDKSSVAGDLSAAQSRIAQAEANYMDLLTEPRIQNERIAHEKVNIAATNIVQAQRQLQITIFEAKDISSNEQRLKTLYEQGAVSFRDYETAKFQKAEKQQSIQAAQSQIKELQYALEAARQELNLIRSGAKKEQLARAAAQINEQESLYKSTQGRIKNYIIRAPIDGYVVKALIKEGEAASTTQPVFRIVSADNLVINADVEENNLKNIKKGQNVYIVFDAYPEKVFNSKVFKVIEDINNTTGTFIAKSYPPQIKEYPMLNGMSCDVTIISKRVKQALIIPYEFIKIENGSYFVFKKNGLWAQKIKIKGEEFDNNRFLVTDGLSAGEVIIQGEKGRLIHDKEGVIIKSRYKINKGEIK